MTCDWITLDGNQLSKFSSVAISFSMAVSEFDLGGSEWVRCHNQTRSIVCAIREGSFGDKGQAI
jgi:hypothetical protein